MFISLLSQNFSTSLKIPNDFYRNCSLSLFSKDWYPLRDECEILFPCLRLISDNLCEPKHELILSKVD